MVDDIHAHALLQLCAAKGWKLLAIGDFDQIPPINVGNPHKFLIQHGATTSFLQNITRQRDNLELLEVVQNSVLGSVDKSFDLLGDNIKQIQDTQLRQIAVVDEYFNSLEKFQQDKIAVATLSNSDRYTINSLIRSRLIMQGKLDNGKTFHVSDGDFYNPVECDLNISVGDRIICLKNDSRLGVRNGTRGKVTDIDDFGNISLQTDSGKKFSFNSNSYNAFDLAYAMTINKLQGATVQKIICNADSRSHFDRNKFYVTVSRAKLDATIFTDDIQKLKKDSQSWSHKVTSDDFIRILQEKIADNKTRVVNSDYISKLQRAKNLQHKFFSPQLILQHRNWIRDHFGAVTIENISKLPAPFIKSDLPVQKISTKNVVTKKIKPSKGFAR